jgi:DNA-binding transcriptional MerR regulator
MNKLKIDGELISENTLTKMLDISVFTLRYWRQKNKGPEFVRLDNGRIRYPKQKIHDWYENQIKNG